MIRHIVMWNFRDELTGEERKAVAGEIKRKLESLPPVIGEIREMRVIVDPKATSTVDLLLTSLFDSEEALAAYQVHPEHKKVSAYVGAHIKSRSCADYEE